jgi:predicted DNA-binding transcriptional regulator AlpA
VKKHAERTAQTRANLMEAFWQIYCEKRLEQITVKEIAARAGYNRSTFYQYFNDASSVLGQIENSLLPTPETLPPISLGEGTTAPLPMDLFIQMYEKNRKYYVVLFGDKGDPLFQSKIKNTVKEMIKNILGRNVVADSFELDYALEFMLSAMIGVLSYWSRSEATCPSDRLLKLTYDMIQKGVANKLPRFGLSTSPQQ